MAVRAMLTADPVASCMVASRIETLGMDPWRLGGELWGCEPVVSAAAGWTPCASRART